MEDYLYHNMDYDLFYRCMSEGKNDINDTLIQFLDDEERSECILGYRRDDYKPVEQDKPYLMGYGCDYPHGAAFSTAKELLEDKAYGGRSIAEAWDQVCVLNLATCELDHWFRKICSFPDEVTQVNGVWKLVK